ncbi:WRKY DNA-binding protein 46 [Euphorbia peplus]|nr:WRKY DNA-binding protein 46 [Euphorbia peplus]
MLVNSPLSCDNSSPMSDFGDQDWEDNSPRNVCKKRKTEPKWSKKLKVCSENENDGYNWRKYGQKDILRANFPRGYYRCSHRHSQGCLATKQVQRSDQDPTTFEVTYRGRHTCFQSSPKDKVKSDKDTFDQFEQKPNPKKIKLKQLSFNYKHGIKIQELEPVEDIFPSFSFPNVEDGNVDNNMFMMEHDLLPTFSPVTSDYLVSPCEKYSFGLDYNVSTPPPEADSNPASVSNSPTGQWDVSIDFTDFEASFPLEELELYA